MSVYACRPICAARETDLASLLPLRASIRLVKGAYNEPAEMAFPEKPDVDENYFALAKEMLGEETEPAMRAAFGTHDIDIVRRISNTRQTTGMPRSDVEVQMLYGTRAPSRNVWRARATVKSAGSLRHALVCMVHRAWRSGPQIYGSWCEICFDFQLWLGQ